MRKAKLCPADGLYDSSANESSKLPHLINCLVTGSYGGCGDEAVSVGTAYNGERGDEEVHLEVGAFLIPHCDAPIYRDIKAHPVIL